MSNHTPAPLNAQPAQGENWELTPLVAKTTRTFGTSTGHKLIVHTVEGSDYSHVSVHVTDETAFINMGFSSFVGDNHRQDYEDYLSRLISSHGLEYVCTHFDALCTPFGDEDIA
jgi:hypothetical protein